MDKEVSFRRSNGQLQKAFVFCIYDNGSIGVTWLENGERFIKCMSKNKIDVKKKNENYDFILLVLAYSLFGILFAIVFYDGLESKFLELQNDYQTCMVKKQNAFFDFYFDKACPKKATFFNAFFKLIIDFASYFSSIFGTIINSFASSAFDGLGIIDLLKLLLAFFSFFFCFLIGFVVVMFLFKFIN